MLFLSVRASLLTLSFGAGVAVLSVPQAMAQESAARIVRVEIVGAQSVPLRELTKAANDAAIGSETRDRAEAVRLAAEAIQAFYLRRGFSVAQVIGSEITTDGVLRLTVAEGQIREIIVRGNTKTQRTTVLLALGLRPGDVYRESKARDGRDTLARLGIFDDVSVKPIPAGTADTSAEPDDTADKSNDSIAKPKPMEPKPELDKPAPPLIIAPERDDQVGLVDVVVRVRERRTGNIAATLGYTDGTGLIGYADVSEDNLFGMAQRVGVEWQRISNAILDRNGQRVRSGDDRQAFGLRYERPALGRRDLAFGADVYNKNTIFLPFFSSNVDTLRTFERRRGGSLRVGRTIGGGLSAFLTARRDEIGFGNIPSQFALSSTERADSTGTVGALGVRLVADQRDNAADPRRGGLGVLSYENAGSLLGGTLRFSRATLDVRRYFPLPILRLTDEGRGNEGGSSTLALRVLGGYAGRNGRGGQVPLPEQFWIGGFDLLRGYDLYQFRGERLLLGSAEARVPLSGGLQGVLFLDAGSVWSRGLTPTPRAGGGIGLRFLTPIGPIRLDAAYGNRLQTYVSLGQAY